MEPFEILNRLENSGIDAVFNEDKTVLIFQDPSCILTAFDTMLQYAWVIAMVMTTFVLLGWAFLYIKNGVKLATFFKNIRSLFMVLLIFCAAKPIVDVVYGDNLFGKHCEIKQVEKSQIDELLGLRKKSVSNSDEALYETFTVIDSGVIYPNADEDKKTEEDEEDDDYDDDEIETSSETETSTETSSEETETEE